MPSPRRLPTLPAGQVARGGGTRFAATEVRPQREIRRPRRTGYQQCVAGPTVEPDVQPTVGIVRANVDHARALTLWQGALFVGRQETGSRIARTPPSRLALLAQSGVDLFDGQQVVLHHDPVGGVGPRQLVDPPAVRCVHARPG